MRGTICLEVGKGKLRKFRETIAGEILIMTGKRVRG